MFRDVTAAAVGVLAALALSVSTVALTLLICLLALFKFLAPEGPFRDRVRHMLGAIAEGWIGLNNMALGLYRKTRWEFDLPEGLDRRGCYLVSSNHQSWVDIPVLQRAFNRRLPFLRFFLKSQLIWVPFLGVAWWALDFPFMKRASRERLARKPGLRGRDLENARKACEKFRNIPVAMMNFPEGTRSTPAKRQAAASSYRNLLAPRVGGTGQVLYALASELQGLVDVTIAYPGWHGPGPAPGLWQLLCGRIPRIVVHARLRPIPEHLRGRDFRSDSEFRKELQAWVEEAWAQKDALLDRINESSAPPPTAI